MIPLDGLDSAQDLFLKLESLGKRIWLDSGIDEHPDKHFDILSAGPIETLENPAIEDLELTHKRHFPEKLQKDSLLESFPFVGGIVGYFNYEYAHESFSLPTHDDTREQQLPSVFGVYDWSIVINHRRQTTHIIFLASCSPERRHQILELLESEAGPQKPFSVAPLIEETSYEEYAKNIERIHAHILDGDTYQINYAQRFSAAFSGAADTAYCHLREALPGPFSAYLELNTDAILSFSPERFISVKHGEAQTKPIKGTIARGQTPDEDRSLAQQLVSSEKNRAENVMIVDLLRNDFSKACEPHSVKVTKLCDLESFKNVHHLVSTIEGKLEKNTSILGFFMNCFPGGSITGAPKKRSMEIIHTLEKHPRNIYCGSICLYSAHGYFDSNIAIRTLCISEGNINCWGGGGIVIDSNAQDEYAESRQKVSSLIEALNKKARQQ